MHCHTYFSQKEKKRKNNKYYNCNTFFSVSLRQIICLKEQSMSSGLLPPILQELDPSVDHLTLPLLSTQLVSEKNLFLKTQFS